MLARQMILDRHRRNTLTILGQLNDNRKDTLHNRLARVSGERHFVVRDVPEGQYTVTVLFEPSMRVAEQTITVAPGEAAEVHLTL